MEKEQIYYVYWKVDCDTNDYVGRYTKTEFIGYLRNLNEHQAPWLEHNEKQYRFQDKHHLQTKH